MLPSKSMVGEEYLLEKDKIDVKIGYVFMGILLPWLSENPVIIDYPFWRIEIMADLSDYSTRIFVYRKISSILYKDAILGYKNTWSYFRGYLSDVLVYVIPILKRDVFNRWYITPIYPTQKNLIWIWLVLLPNLGNLEEPRFVHIIPILDAFPFSSIMPKWEYMHDLLEAMQWFIDLDISEALRYLYSALDALRVIYLSKKERRLEFIDWIELLLNNTSLSQLIIETIFYNINIWYALRNQVVHQSKRISYWNLDVIHKILSSILYLFKWLDQKHFDYYMELEIQFLAVKNHYFWINLDYLKLPTNNESKIEPYNDLDWIMMRNIRINYTRDDIKNLLLDF